MEDRSKKEAFYRRFVLEITGVTHNSLLTQLYYLGLLTKEERDEICDLNTFKNRKKFLQILEAKDYACLPKLIQAFGQVLGPGHSKMVNDMQQYLRETEPNITQEQMDPTPSTSTQAQALRNLQGTSHEKVQWETKHQQKPSAATTEVTPPPPPLAIPMSTIIPGLVHNFVERKRVLKELHALVMRTPGVRNNAYALLTSLYGLGGIGKTTLARRYVDFFQEEFPNGRIFWIESETRSTLRLAFRSIGKTFGVSERTGMRELVRLVYEHVTRQTCLFIFDNVTAYEGKDGIIDFLPYPSPGPKHYILATSRKKDLIGTDRVLHLDVLNAEESNELISKSLPQSTSLSRTKLSFKLGYLPLALQQAIAYIVHSKDLHKDQTSAIDSYLREYTFNAGRMLRTDVYNEEGRKIEKTVYLTWQTTLATIAKHENGRFANMLLRCLAFLNPDNIDISFLNEIDLRFGTFSVIASRMRLRSPMCSKNGLYNHSSSYRTKMNSAIVLLSTYSMITAQEGRISIHRLVQEVVRLRTRNDFVNESTLVERIVAGINSSQENNIEQNILHGTTVFPYYQQYKYLISRYPKFSEKIFAYQGLIERILNESPSQSRSDAMQLIQVLQSDDTSIDRALKCVKALRTPDPLKSYLDTSARVCSANPKLSSEYVPDMVKLFNWISVLDETKDTLLRRILYCLPFLYTSEISLKFVSTILNEPEEEVHMCLLTLLPYGILAIATSEDSYIYEAEVPKKEQLQEYSSSVFSEYLDLVLTRLEKIFYFTEISEECLLHCEELTFYLDSYPGLSEKTTPRTEFIGKIQTHLPGLSRRLAIRLAFKFKFDLDITEYVCNFISRFSAFAPGEFNTAKYLDLCATIERFHVFELVKKLGDWEVAKYLNWMVAACSVCYPKPVKPIMYKLLFLDSSYINLEFLDEICGDEGEVRVPQVIEWLAHIELVKLREGHIIHIEVPDEMKAEQFWNAHDWKDAAKEVVEYIFNHVHLKWEHRAQCILHGYRLFNLSSSSSFSSDFQITLRFREGKRAMKNYKKFINILLQKYGWTSLKEAVLYIDSLDQGSDTTEKCGWDWVN